MNVFARGMVVLGSGFWGVASFVASAQLASTQLDGLQINCTGIYPSGDSRDLDCSIGLEFTGQKADHAVRVSRVKIIRAEDDTGMDLVRTNKNFPPGSDSPGSDGGLFQMIRGLKSPAPKAKAIRQLEAEARFFSPTADTPVLTNFMSKPGQVLHQILLDKYQLEIRCGGTTKNSYPPGSLIIDASAGKTISLGIDDPQKRLVGVAFQMADGNLLRPSRTSQGVFGSHTEFTYQFQQVPPPNLNLLVYVDAPEAPEEVRFTLENIRLPWVDPPDLQVSAKPATVRSSINSNSATCNLVLNFTGGALTNALGIRKLWINRVTDDAGQEVKLGHENWRFDALPPVMGDGRNIRKLVPLIFPSRDPASIRLMEGVAELVLPAATNDGLVVIKDFMNHAGESFDQPGLKRNQVKLAYLGPVNYATKRQDFARTGVAESGFLPTELPSGTNNSVEFALDDSDNLVLAPWGGEDITLIDNQGRTQPVVGRMTSGRFRVYRFKTLPPPGTQLVLYLAVPESLKHIPFSIKNIPLNQPAGSFHIK